MGTFMEMQSHYFTSRHGKKVHYYTYGNPAAKPLFFIHGFPGTGQQGLLLLRGSPYEQEFYLIAMDRPGYGLAEHEPDFSLKKFTEYAGELMDLLGYNKFVVVSISGGGPYAAAMSFFLAHRIQATVSINGIAPMDFKRFPFLNQAQKKMYLLNKLLPRPAIQYIVEQLYNKNADRIDQILVSDFEGFSPNDRKALDDPKTGPYLLETFKFSVMKGPYGLLSDMRLYLEPWGFKIKDIKVPYYLYHGTADDIVHPIWSRFMKAELTDVRLKFFDGEGHYSLPYNYRDHFLRDIITDLM